MRILSLEIQVGIAVLLLLLIRPGMRKLPGVYSYLLWLLVFARLLVPVSFESRFGLMPSFSGAAWQEVFGGTDVTTTGEDVGDISGDTEGRNEKAVGSETAALIRDGNEGATGEALHAGTGYAASGSGEGNEWKTGAVGTESAVNAGRTDGGYETGKYGMEIDGIGNRGEPESAMDAGHLTGDGLETDSLINENKEIGGADTIPPGGIIMRGNWQMSDSRKIILLALWAAGAAAILAYNGIALLLVKRQVRGTECLRDNIYVGSQVKSPFTLGMLRPEIYLPMDLPEAEREYIICHESIHIRRRDYLVKNAAFLLTALHWFNPFVWIAFYFMGRDMELSCDERVIGKMGEEIKKQYSQSLLNFAQGKCPGALTPITFGENSVKQRVKNVLSYQAAPRWTAVLGAGIILILAAMMFTVRSNAEQGSGAVPAAGPEGQMSFTDNIPAVRGVGASPEILQMGFLLARRSPYGALECWARAFTDRNGNALFQLAADKEGFQQWERVTEAGNGSFAFGDSSPWPWAYDYEITMLSEEPTAEITFHMRTSAPEIYLVREKVRLTESEGLYYVDHESTRDNYSIETAQEYEDAYVHEYHVEGNAGNEENGNADSNGVDESIDGNDGYAVMAALYDNSFYRAILTQLLEGDNTAYYLRYTDPVTAARTLLHLGAGEGEVTEWHMVPASQLRSADAGLPEWASMPAPDWLQSSSASGVGSRVIVSYTFAEDGSCIEIPMEIKEESQGIWGLVGGGIKETYSMVSEPGMIEHEEGKADLTYAIELSNYGIYRLGAHSGLTCLWAGDVGQEAVTWFSDNRLYIFQSLERAKDNSPDGAEVVFVYDLLTGELYREHLAIPENYRHIFPEVDFGVDGGFVQIYGFGRTYTLPLENLNEPLWEQKTFRQMSPEDRQAYGVANREYLLDHPDTLVRLSVREPGQTSAFLDLDGDGRSEQVILSADPDDRGQYWEYDNYRLQAGESVIAGSGDRVHNDIWAYSPDGETILLALYEDGPSGDPRTALYGYEKGELRALGEFSDDIRSCTMENGVISGRQRCEVIQTDAIHASWRIGDSGQVELVPQEVYDLVAQNEVELLEELPVQSHLLPEGEDSIYFGIRYFTISPQTVRFLQTDSTFSWVCVEAADGSRGWFQMDGYRVKELGKDRSEVFGGMYYGEGF